MTVKIAVYSIAKNEEEHVDRWYDSIADADTVYVLDTGSEDDTYGRLKDLEKEVTNLRVYDAAFQPFRFDYARNFILNQISDHDYAMFIDMDEVMEDGWYNKLVEYIEKHPEADGINLRMIYTVNADNSPDISYNRLMVTKPDSYLWKYPVHEVLIPEIDRDVQEVYTDIKVYHQPSHVKKRDYMDLLKIGYAEIGDARSCYYYAKELVTLEQYDDAINIGREAYTKETNYWLRSEICSFIGYAFDQVDEYMNAKYWYIRGYSEAFDIRESWAWATEFYMKHKRYYSAIGCLENMLEVFTPPSHTIIRQDNLYNERPYHLLALCYEALNDKETAKANILKAFDMKNTNQQLAFDMLRICEIPVTTK